MARPLRIQYPNAVYHVTCRGNERQSIFRDGEDRKRFLRILSQSLNIYTVKLYSYVLMNNHFHLLVETPLGNLSEFMRKFNITYTGYYNRRHARIGHLYQGRYKSILVDKDGYLSALSRYIHLNPVKIKSAERMPLKDKIEHLISYPWSSLPGFINKRKKEGFIDYSMVLDDYGGDTDSARKEYKKRIYEEITEGIDIKDHIIGQSILGDEAFVAWIKDKYIEGAKDRERPSIGQIHRYRTKKDILHAIEQETGKDLDAIRAEKGELRQIAMELLYRAGGLKGPEIGRLFGIGYGPVSQERKRLRERFRNDEKLGILMRRIEGRLSSNEI
jgi:putative transposase